MENGKIKQLIKESVSVKNDSEVDVKEAIEAEVKNAISKITEDASKKYFRNVEVRFNVIIE